MAGQVPVAEGLFEERADGPVLVGGRCADCGHIDFPLKRHCLKCFDGVLEKVDLPRRGTLWTFTTQQFPPPSPPYAGTGEFEPFAVGYVELPGALRVEARLTEASPEGLTIGQEMELTIVSLGESEDGGERTIFAFQPVARTTV